MNTEYLPEIGFFKEIALSKHVWLARRGLSVLTMKNQDGGLSLPVWSDRGKLNDFLKLKCIENTFHLIQFPLNEFEKTFIENTNITEFQINPSGTKKGGLVLTIREFKVKLDKFKGATLRTDGRC